MSSLLESMAAKATMGGSGQVGSKTILPLDVDKIVTSTDMTLVAYVIAAQPVAPCRLSVTVTADGAADTMGTLVFVGTDIDDAVITETVTPVVGSTVYTTKEFKTVTSATSVGWVTNGNADDIQIGVAGIIAGTNKYFCAIYFVSESVVAAQTEVTSARQADLTQYTIPADRVINTKLTHIRLTSGLAIGYLQDL